MIRSMAASMDFFRLLIRRAVAQTSSDSNCVIALLASLILLNSPRSTSMTSILPIRNIKARPPALVPPQKPVFNHQNKTHRAGNRTDALGEVVFFGLAAGLFKRRLGRFVAVVKVSEPIQDLVGPEPLEPVQRLVQRCEFLVRDAADLFHGLDVLLIERVDDAADFLALRREADADRAAIDARALMIEEAEFDQLLQIVGNVGAEVIAARAQFARGQFLVADVIE